MDLWEVCIAMLTSVDLSQGEGPLLQAWLLSWVVGANADTAGRDSRWRQAIELREEKSRDCECLKGP